MRIMKEFVKIKNDNNELSSFVVEKTKNQSQQQAITEDEENLSESIVHFPNISPLIGFEMTAFSGTDSNLICLAAGDRFFSHINLDNCNDTIIYYDVRGPISVIVVSYDYRFLALCMDHKHGAIIVIKDCHSFQTIKCFIVK